MAYELPTEAEENYFRILGDAVEYQTGFFVVSVIKAIHDYFYDSSEAQQLKKVPYIFYLSEYHKQSKAADNFDTFPSFFPTRAREEIFTLYIAVRDGLVVINPAVGIKLPKVHQKEKSSLSDNEVKRILQVAKDYCDNPKTKNKNTFPLINLALVSGLRCGELLALTWDNIDFKTGKIYVTNSVCELKDKIIIKTTKTDASKRSMIISASILDILHEHRKNFATGRFVFPNTEDKDKPQAPSNICRVYRKILSPAGVKSSLHILRHTNITKMITAGTDIKTVKNRAGHTRIETTMSYIHPSEEFDRQAADIFE